MMQDLYQFKKKLAESNLIFCYSGPLSQDLMAEIGDTIREKLKMDDVSKNSISRVFAILIEQTQNIIHYSAERMVPGRLSDENDKKVGLGIISVGIEATGYIVLCGNQIENHKVAHLTKYLNDIKAMDKDELKKLHKKKRKQGPEGDSKGAGLGFIEMAKKSSKPIEFSFEKIDADHSFFTIKTTVD